MNKKRKKSVVVSHTRSILNKLGKEEFEKEKKKYIKEKR